MFVLMNINLHMLIHNKCLITYCIDCCCFFNSKTTE